MGIIPKSTIPHLQNYPKYQNNTLGYLRLFSSISDNDLKPRRHPALLYNKKIPTSHEYFSIKLVL